MTHRPIPVYCPTDERVKGLHDRIITLEEVGFQ